MAATTWRSVSDYVRSLDLDAWEVGGAVRDRLLERPVRDTDFVVPRVGHAELRRALAPHGRVEDLVVAGQRVGVRLHPRDAAARALAPAGIEFAPPRTERSTGPGRHDFEIVADPSISLEEDMRRRDFTINAIALHLATEEVLDPLGGRADLRRGILRTTSPSSFRDDPLRLVRGLRFVSELGLDPDEETLAQMRAHADAIEHVSGERIGGGLAADGLGELSKLLLGRHPAKALRLARDTGVLVHVLPEFSPVLGVERANADGLTLDEHVFATVQEGAELGAPLPVRLALLFHDLGKPHDQDDHAAAGARLAARALARLRYPARLQAYVRRLVAAHAFHVPPAPSPLEARRFLAEHGDEPAGDLLVHKRADLRAKRRADELARLEELARLVEAERGSPHRLADLAVDGTDLLALGYRPGPALGRALAALLAEVVDDPGRNERGTLLARARELL